MTIPLISVLMTVRNGLPYIYKAIDSILNQTERDFEFFILDDGSTDNTWEVLEHYAKQDHRIKVVRNKENLGIARSANILLAMTQGQYITKPDADDVSEPSKFEQQRKFLDAHPNVGLVATTAKLIDENEQEVKGNHFTKDLDNDTLQKQLLVANCFCQGSVMFRRELLNQVGLYDEKFVYSQDYDLWLRIAEVTQIVKLPEQLYQYRIHTASVSQKHRKLQAMFTAEALDRAVERRFGKAPSSEQWKTAAMAYLKAAIVSAFAGDFEMAHTALERAMTFKSVLFNTFELLETYLVDYSYESSIEKRVNLYGNVFDRLLIDAPEAMRFRGHILSRLHFSEVFRCASFNDWSCVTRHLWPGLKYSPVWLFNKGVLVIILKTLVWQVRQRMNDKQDRSSV